MCIDNILGLNTIYRVIKCSTNLFWLKFNRNLLECEDFKEN